MGQARFEMRRRVDGRYEAVLVAPNGAPVMTVTPGSREAVLGRTLEMRCAAAYPVVDLCGEE